MLAITLAGCNAVLQIDDLERVDCVACGDGPSPFDPSGEDDAQSAPDARAGAEAAVDAAEALPVVLDASGESVVVPPPPPDDASSDGAPALDAPPDVAAIPDAPGDVGSDASVCSSPAGITPGTACSNATGRQVGVTIKNGCATEALRVSWYNRACTEVDYGTVSAGATFSIGAFAGQVWRLRNAASGALVYEFSVTGAMTVRAP